jgi:hypothetical protein
MAQVFQIRKQGNGLYGLGEEISPNVCLFKAGMYDLTKEELARVVNATTVQPDKSAKQRGRQ